MSYEFRGTPGPWDWAHVSMFGGRHATIHIRQADGAPYTPEASDVAAITEVDTYSNTGSTAEKNAKLIAAAPELFEALVYGLENLEYGSDIEDFKEVAQAALAKATGDKA